ncbi:MAG: hypothetical protein Q8Q04_00990 [archaeon]|nr:hypothetical protein [archaeon]
MSNLTNSELMRRLDCGNSVTSNEAADELIDRYLVNKYKPSLEKVSEKVEPTKRGLPESNSNVKVGVLENLIFVTNKELYTEIVGYMDKTFPESKRYLSGMLAFDDGVMKGSNPYVVVGTDMFLRKVNSGYRVATQADLEKNLDMFSGFYVDSGLAIRDSSVLKGLKISNDNLPVFINLRGLEINNNFGFTLSKESLIKRAKCLNWTNGTHFSKINDYGLPKEEDKSSKRQIRTGNSALSRVYLYGGGYLDVGDGDLGDSSDYGRVVLAKVNGGKY